MYELIQLTEHDYYIDCPAKIGLVRIDEDNVVLIDSGNDKDAGKKVFRILEANGWNLKAIFNTHSHADHIGMQSTANEDRNTVARGSGAEPPTIRLVAQS